MGKKDGNRKRKADEYESENEADDGELQAELAALLAARKEKMQGSSINDESAPTERVTMYNKEGLLKCIEELDTNMPFSETLIVSEFAATIINENDDIEREVIFISMSIMFIFALILDFSL